MLSKRVAAIVALLSLSLLLAAPVALADQEMDVLVTPGTVEIGVNYGGADLSVKGLRPDGADIVLKVTSPATDVSLSKKGKVFGIFWMTTEKVVVSGMPVFYGVYASGSLQRVLNAQEQDRLGIDRLFSAITTRAKVHEGNTALEGAEAEEFVGGLRDLRVKDGLFSVDEGGVSLSGSSWESTVKVPSAAPPGEYDIEVYAVKGGQVVAQSTATFAVRKAGMVASLGSLANQNGTVYGVLAVVVAVSVGLGVGRVFKGGGGH